MPRQDTSFPTKFSLILKIQNLCDYTDKITSNEKLFKRPLRQTIVKRLQDSAYSILKYATTANALLIDNANDAPKRLENERLAIAECDYFTTLIEIAANNSAIGKRRADYWAGIVRSIRRMAYNWYCSDAARARKASLA